MTAYLRELPGVAGIALLLLAVQLPLMAISMWAADAHFYARLIEALPRGM